ncbi:riboflavine-aldehyde-forming enzyme [Armillaria borealis]|uniref:Riboflavine-aldehyde-forming enzyme n=1 Tax=Armillaria borealis TaxID=47425 RepID=A0AA39JV68_9AGAR|nr:riboflavine-aldehyde-forming enzyme [Armillaria borealis]
MFFTRILAFLSVSALLAAALPLVPRANSIQALGGLAPVVRLVSTSGATANPNLNPICGKKLVATYGGKSVTVTVTDKCMGCAGMYDLDFTPTAFSRLASTDVGRLTGVDWTWA